MKRFLLAIGMLAACYSASTAATIKTYPKDGGVLVTVEGEFDRDDVSKFEVAVAPYDKGAVIFASGGGSAFTGLQIGQMIRIKGFSTVVLDGNICASACALSWLGGVKRYMGTEAKVGFHAVFEKNQDGTETEIGSGNALAGAYMSRLGLPDRALVYATKAPPQGITWLTPDDAQKEGIEVTMLPPAKQKEAKASPATPAP